MLRPPLSCYKEGIGCASSQILINCSLCIEHSLALCRSKHWACHRSAHWTSHRPTEWSCHWSTVQCFWHLWSSSSLRPLIYSFYRVDSLLCGDFGRWICELFGVKVQFSSWFRSSIWEILELDLTFFSWLVVSLTL